MITMFADMCTTCMARVDSSGSRVLCVIKRSSTRLFGGGILQRSTSSTQLKYFVHTVTAGKSHYI